MAHTLTPSRSGRLTVAVLVVLVTALTPAGTTAAACWRPPVAAPVVDPFRAPACRWCPGNRGIEYRTRPGQLVTAVESGRVRYAGTVAGTVYVVIEHRDGRRATYGHLAGRRVDAGAFVRRGQIVGSAGPSLHFGVRSGDDYVDPAPSIGVLVGRPRLVPTDGSAPAPPPPPIVRCRPVGGGAIAESAR